MGLAPHDTQNKKPAKPTAIDLFCGAGGMAVGLEHAGFSVHFAADKWKPAVETYSLNFQHEVMKTELSWETEVPDADLFAGGPPCQGFSSAGTRTPGDARNNLVAVFAHLVAMRRPKCFLFENVEGFLTGDDGRWVLDLLRPLVAAGYSIGVRKVNAANYGVPQNRKRVIVIGGLGWYPGFPEPTHRAFGAPGVSNVATGCPPTPNVEDALEGLPEATPAGRGADEFDHTFRQPSERVYARFKALSPGQTMRDLPRELWHDTYKRRANRRVADGTPLARRGGAPAGVRRLDGEQPSKAITRGAVSEFVHPSLNRTLTLRECARLQTFPDDFRFTGSKSQRALLIGNAIPPLLAEKVLTHVHQGLSEPNRLQTEPGVLEFTPTSSKGMSPSLKRTTEAVRREFTT